MPVSPLLDSTSAALGALFATLVLYPLDVSKTRVQAERDPRRRRGTLATMAQIVQEGGPLDLLVGVGPKAVSTVASTFAFYLFHAALKRVYARTGRKAGAGAALTLASVAGALNMCVTLPAEVVTTRLQAGTREDRETVSQCVRNIHREQGARGFWRGFWASMLLVANPAINTTVYDALKLRVLRAMSTYRARRVHALSSAQAFLLGSLAKAVATVATYPLIRAKVVLQADRTARAAECTADAGVQPRTAPKSTMTVLAHVCRAEGVRGLYRGCDAQLLTTVLKSGLLLMTKEQTLRLAIRLLRAKARQL